MLSIAEIVNLFLPFSNSPPLSLPDLAIFFRIGEKENLGNISHHVVKALLWDEVQLLHSGPLIAENLVFSNYFFLRTPSTSSLAVF